MVIQRKHSSGWSVPVAVLALCLLCIACSDDEGPSCTVIENQDGSATITCPDGSTATIPREWQGPGDAGAAGDRSGDRNAQSDSTGVPGVAGDVSDTASQEEGGDDLVSQEPTPWNRCPTAVARGRLQGTTPWSTWVSAASGETVELDGSLSYDRDGAVVSYSWTLH